MSDATAEDFLRIARVLREVDVPGFGTVYVNDPPTVAERDASNKHFRIDPDDGTISTSLEGIVDGVIARLKDKDGRPVFRQIHRKRMLDEMAPATLLAIWGAIGGDGASDAALVAEAKKN